MIRRDTTGPDQTPAWILISQIQHAQVAAELASHWVGYEPLTAGSPLREMLLASIARHDDGWQQWDQSPQIDPLRGRPFDFTEMPPDDSLAIWRESIEMAAGIGPLSAYMVAGHFLKLLHRSDSWAAGPDSAAARWSGDFEQRRGDWLATWVERTPAAHSVELAKSAIETLQFFDMLSLWLCCSEKPKPLVLKAMDGQEYAVARRAADRITIKPFPLDEGH